MAASRRRGHGSHRTCKPDRTTPRPCRAPMPRHSGCRSAPRSRRPCRPGADAPRPMQHASSRAGPTRDGRRRGSDRHPSPTTLSCRGHESPRRLGQSTRDAAQQRRGLRGLGNCQVLHARGAWDSRCKDAPRVRQRDDRRAGVDGEGLWRGGPAAPSPAMALWCGSCGGVTTWLGRAGNGSCDAFPSSRPATVIY
jgi:hypothetical protein